MQRLVAIAARSIATWTLFAGCSSSGATAGDAGADADCVDPPAAYTCRLGTSAQLYPIDESAGCVGAEVTLPNLCVSSVSCDRAASIAAVCLVSPSGALYYATMTNDQDITGPGWHEVHSRGYGAPLPAENQPTAQDLTRCSAAETLPCCPGVAPPLLLCPIHDAGAVDASADGG